MKKLTKNPKGIPTVSYRASKKIIIGIIIILGIFSISSVAFSQDDKLLVSWPDSPAGTPLNDESTLPDLIKYLYEWGIVLGGLAAFIALVIAGFQYLTSEGDPAKMKEGMDRIKSAGLGLVLLLATWLILNTINPELTTLQLPPLELEEKAMIGLECKTSLDCYTGYKCICTKGRVNKEGTAENPCLLEPDTEEPGGICFPREDLMEGTRCTKATYGFTEIIDGTHHIITGGEIEVGQFEELTTPIEGGALFWAQGYIGDELCGVDAIYGTLSESCQQCDEGDAEACKKCCLSCYAEIKFFSDEGGNFEVDSYVLLSSVAAYPMDVDAHSIGMFEYKTTWDKLTPDKPTIWEILIPPLYAPKAVDWIKDLKDLF